MRSNRIFRVFSQGADGNVRIDERQVLHSDRTLQPLVVAFDRSVTADGRGIRHDIGRALLGIPKDQVFASRRFQVMNHRNGIGGVAAAVNGQDRAVDRLTGRGLFPNTTQPDARRNDQISVDSIGSLRQKGRAAAFGMNQVEHVLDVGRHINRSIVGDPVVGRRLRDNHNIVGGIW